MRGVCYVERSLTIPVLVDHHNAEQHAERKDEDSIDVMRNSVANGIAEGDHDDDSGNVEEYPERLNNTNRVNSMHRFLAPIRVTYDVSNSPSVI